MPIVLPQSTHRIPAETAPRERPAGAVAARAAGAGASRPLDLTTVHIPPQPPLSGDIEPVLDLSDYLPHTPDKFSKTPLEPDKSYKLFVPLGGSMCKLKGKSSNPNPPKPGMRGKAGFSSRSRKRLLQLMASLDRDTRPPLFLGLTYPGDDWPSSAPLWHDHIEAFYKRLCRKYPMCNVSILWRLEPQHRGAPHFHLLVFGVPFIPYQWVGAAWADITDGNAATCSRVERVKSWRGAMSYASKYLGKAGKGEEFTTADGELIEDVGRHWGVKGRKHLPATWVAYVLLQHEFHQIRRQLGRYVRSKGRNHRVRGRHGGVWCFMQGSDALRLLGHYASDAPMAYEAPKL